MFVLYGILVCIIILNKNSNLLLIESLTKIPSKIFANLKLSSSTRESPDNPITSIKDTFSSPTKQQKETEEEKKVEEKQFHCSGQDFPVAILIMKKP